MPFRTHHLFHGMELVVPSDETVCFKWRNSLFHSVKQTDTCGLTILVDQEIDFDMGYETNIPWIEAI